VISETIPKDNDEIFTRSDNHHKTEKTMTVLRAVANWIRDLEDSSRNS
jgi:hypothetical protein